MVARLPCQSPEGVQYKCNTSHVRKYMESEAEMPDVGKTSMDVNLPNTSTGYAEGSAGEASTATPPINTPNMTTPNVDTPLAEKAVPPTC